MITKNVYEQTIIYESNETIITRRQTEENQTVIVKTTKHKPTVFDVARYKNEFQLLNEIQSPHIIQAMELIVEEDEVALILVDDAALSLEHYLQQTTLTLIDKLHLMIQLTTALQSIHNHHILFKDFNPSNIIIVPETHHIKVIDFGIATKMSSQQQQAVPPTLLEGTIAYMSPEQTGRMNRSMDTRSDIYSLGISFYKLLTDELPFCVNDSMELIHCHLAKQPVPLHKIRADIPTQLTEIVLKCLAKNAEDRYNSCHGLLNDLKQCLQQYVQTQSIKPFPIAQQDRPMNFTLVQKLYGREHELDLLMQSFTRVSKGAKELVEIAGYSGIGKSALVNELYKPLVKEHGIFIGGKCEQYKRNQPYDVLIQSLKQLVQYILTDSEDHIDQWREQIMKALQSNGQIIIDVIPELEHIIGPQQPVKQLAQLEASQRFHYVFQSFLNCFASENHPLVLFIDDMQWIDSASLQFIQTFMQKTNVTHFLLICSYRDNELVSTHPYFYLLENLQQSSIPILTLTLKPLQKSHIQQLIEHSIPFEEQSLPALVDYIYMKTEGNPFFTNHLLLSLYEEEFIFFDMEKQVYNWGQRHLNKLQIGENILSLMLAKIQRLPLDVQRTLTLAAAIGNTFDVKHVAIVCELSVETTIKHLTYAYEQGLIIPTNEAFQIFQARHAFKNDEQPTFTFKFVHDRIQQASYSMIHESERCQLHVHIGKLLHEGSSPQQLEEQLFAIVNHFNMGISLIEDEQERIQLAVLNVRAAQKAKAAVAYEPALKYLHNAEQLTQLSDWHAQYEVNFTIVKELMECYFITHERMKAESYFDILLTHAKSKLEIAEAYYIKTLIYQDEYQYELAIDACIKGLKLLDIKIPKRLITVSVCIELIKTIWQYRKINIDDIPNLPITNDRAAEVASMLAVSLANNSYFVNVQQGFIGVLKMNQRSLKYGNTSTSAFTYLSYAIATNTIFGDYTKGHHIGRVAMDYLENIEDPLAPRNYFTFATGVNHWHKHIKTNREYTLKGYHTAIETGDIIYVGYNASLLVEEMLYYGEHLPTIEKELLNYQQYLETTLNKTNEEMLLLFKNYMDTLQGELTGDSSIIGEQFDEELYLQKFSSPTNVFRFYIAKMDLLLLFNRPAEALQVAKQAYTLRNSSMGQLRGAMYLFYYFLTLTANFNSFNAGKMHRTSLTLKSIQRKFAKLAKHCPENFEHQHQLLCAEMARVHRLHDKAFHHYDNAIRFAKQNGYLSHQAKACELAGQHALSCQNMKLAQLYLQEAYTCYKQWGATKKQAQLRHQYEEIFVDVKDSNRQLGEQKFSVHKNIVSNTTSANNSQLDVTTILKASQMISNEIKLEHLLTKLMQNVMENAGAEKGLLFIPTANEWFIEAQAAIENDSVKVLQSLKIADNEQFAHSIFHYVRRTKQSVVLHEAITDERFENDDYIKRSKPKSILCMPILYQHQLVAILYLENNLSTHIFTNNRIELLNILASQAAISISNARLYETLDDQVKLRTQELEEALITIQQTQEQLVEAEKFSSLGNLVAGVAHEINTPIGVSVTAVSHLNYKTAEFAQLFENNQIKKSTLEKYLLQVQETSLMITTNLQRASDLIRSFKQVAVDQSTDIKRELHMKSYIDDTLLSLKPNFKNRAVTIGFSCPDDCKIVSNAGAISQIFTNLIMNALTHAFKDGRAGHIEIMVVQHEQQLQLQFNDNGCGMRDDVRQKMFEPFFTTNRGNGGTGLGMHIVYNIVTQTLGGTIQCESEVDIGTTFTIMLPL